MSACAYHAMCGAASVPFRGPRSRYVVTEHGHLHAIRRTVAIRHRPHPWPTPQRPSDPRRSAPPMASYGPASKLDLPACPTQEVAGPLALRDSGLGLSWQGLSLSGLGPGLCLLGPNLLHFGLLVPFEPPQRLGCGWGGCMVSAWVGYMYSSAWFGCTVGLWSRAWLAFARLKNEWCAVGGRRSAAQEVGIGSECMVAAASRWSSATAKR